MKKIVIALAVMLTGMPGLAYERLQGPTELSYWDRSQTCDGYNFFGANGTTYLLDMEGRVAHTWPVGINPRLLENGNVLDAVNGEVSGFAAFREVDWNGSNIWNTPNLARATTRTMTSSVSTTRNWERTRRSTSPTRPLPPTSALPPDAMRPTRPIPM